jgi:hypothetical protein
MDEQGIFLQDYTFESRDTRLGERLTQAAASARPDCG